MMTIQPLKPHGCGERDYQQSDASHTPRFIPTIVGNVVSLTEAPH